MAVQEYKCRICGKTVIPSLYRVDRLSLMVPAQLCYECVMWKNLADSPRKGSKVINGECLTFTENPHWDPAVTKARKYFVLNNDRTLEICFNPVSIGKVPLHFRHRFPDTAKLISWQLFRRIAARRHFHCMRKGCYDRYHCLWYDKETMEPKGAWNTVPDKYQPGWEECPLFINKNKI